MLSSVLRSKNGRKNKDTGSSIKNVEDDNREKMDGRFAPAQPVGWDTRMVCEVIVAQDEGCTLPLLRVLIFFVPGHLNGFEFVFVGTLGIILEFHGLPSISMFSSYRGRRGVAVETLPCSTGSRRALGGLVALDGDLACASPHLRSIVPGLHPEQHVHAHIEGLLNTQCHLRR